MKDSDGFQSPLRRFEERPDQGVGRKNKRGLRGKGPTPKAEDRVYHKAHKAAQQRKNSNASAQAKRKKKELGPNMVAGRNSVLEALREGVPATAMYVSGRIDADDRVRESITLATQRGISMLEASKPDLDRLTDDAIHQGIALQVPPYDYADPSDLLEFAADRAETPLLVALDGITDPRNLGAIVRSTAAFGGHGVIIPERRAASMTAAAWRPPPVRIAHPRGTGCQPGAGDRRAEEAERLRRRSRHGRRRRPAGLAFTRDPLCIVVARGRAVASHLGEVRPDRVDPDRRDTESLNAGIAAAVSLYEVARAAALTPLLPEAAQPCAGCWAAISKRVSEGGLVVGFAELADNRMAAAVGEVDDGTDGHPRREDDQVRPPRLTMRNAHARAPSAGTTGPNGTNERSRSGRLNRR